MTCGRKACAKTEAPSKQPVILIWASPAKDHKPARMELRLPMCAPCAAETVAEDLLSDEGKAQIEAALDKLGRAAPDWSTAAIEWVALDS